MLSAYTLCCNGEKYLQDKYGVVRAFYFLGARDDERFESFYDFIEKVVLVSGDGDYKRMVELLRKFRKMLFPGKVLQLKKNRRAKRKL